MKCMKCGYESAAPFVQCPACGNVQNPTPYKVNHKRSGGEIAAIIISIVVSVLSLIAAFIICVSFFTYKASKTLEQYGIDSFDDFDSNEYDDEMDEFFKKYYGKDNPYNADSPAGLNTPIQYKATLYSFSEGEIQTEYEVSMTATYRGEAAMKLLEGAALPDYDKDQDEIYLVRFNIAITEQDKDAIVALPGSYPKAYPANNVSLFSSGYTTLSLDYANQYHLISKGENVETYVAFIVSKTDARPCIMWDSSENKVFRDEGEAVSDPSQVEAGLAIEKKVESSSEDTSSDETASSDDTTSD